MTKQSYQLKRFVRGSRPILVKETIEALLVQLSPLRKLWIPKSQCTIYSRQDRNEHYILSAASWWITQNNLESLVE